MKSLVYILPFFLCACSSLPTTIQAPPTYDVQLEDVSKQFTKYNKSAVRWGGKIITVNNSEQGSLLQIVQFPLNRTGRPIATDNSQGRFLIESALFLDPEVFKVGRLATFSGVITAQQQRQIDQKRLLLPVIQMLESHLWSEKMPIRSDFHRNGFAFPYRINGFYGWPYYGARFRCF